MIWSPDDVFSAGANLESLMPVFMKLGAKGVAPEIKKLQDAMLRMRYAQVPVVAAMRGIALGGVVEKDGERLGRSGCGAYSAMIDAFPYSNGMAPMLSVASGESIAIITLLCAKVARPWSSDVSRHSLIQEKRCRRRWCGWRFRYWLPSCKSGKW